MHRSSASAGIYTIWACLTLLKFCHAFNDDNSTSLNSTQLNSGKSGYNGTTNLGDLVTFHFEKDSFKYVGSIDTSEIFAKGDYQGVGPALWACWHQISHFYPNSESTTISPGTNTVFYLDTWQFRLRWGTAASASPLWTRGVLEDAWLKLKDYFEKGDGRAYDRYGLKVTIRFSTQQSIFSLDVSQPISAQLKFRSGQLGMYGDTYPRDPLPATDCSNVFDRAIRWATSKGLNSKVIQGEWTVFVYHDVSFRIYTGPFGSKAAGAAKYRDLVKMLQTYRSQITRSGQPGWTASRITWGFVSKNAAGNFELASGSLPYSPAIASPQNLTIS